MNVEARLSCPDQKVDRAVLTTYSRLVVCFILIERANTIGIQQVHRGRSVNRKRTIQVVIESDIHTSI